MDQITNRLPGIIAIHNDICVFGKTQEHDKHLLQILKTAAKQGLIFNGNKCHISQPQITFYRTIISAQGMKPHPIKIQALKDLPLHRHKKQLQLFLRLVNYLQPFLSDIAQQNNISIRTNFKMGLEPLNRQLFPEVKAMDMQHTPKNNPHIL